MIKLKINNIEVQVNEGTSILQAAQSLGINIPSMCYLEGQSNHPSCMICVVKDQNSNKLMPSCAMPVAYGMDIITEDDEITEARKDTLELLLSDHVGDCEAPCKLSCPAHMDIPLMNRLIGEEKYAEALKVVKEDIALPLILGYICSAPCENACRRKQIDEAVSICQLKKFIAEIDLESDKPYYPQKLPTNNNKVAIIGSGPTGLSAAFYVTKWGHDVAVFDKHSEAGGSLFQSVEDHTLPIEALQKEIAYLNEYGVKFNLNQNIDQGGFIELKNDFDAIIIATGNENTDQFSINQFEKTTCSTNIEKVFAAGSVIKKEKMAIRCVAQGKEVAIAVNQFLSNEELTKRPKRFNSKFGKLFSSEFDEYLKESTRNQRNSPDKGKLGLFLSNEATFEAKRCMHCDCRDQNNCKLREYSDIYKANQRKYLFGERREIKKNIQHDFVIYEPEKCIRCGLCIDITSKEQESIGLTFIGRGFDVRVQIPFNNAMNEALTITAKKCVEACPTGSLAIKRGNYE